MILVASHAARRTPKIASAHRAARPGRGRSEESDIEAGSEELQTDFVTRMRSVESQVLQLAEAFPAETYPWRPATGVRSVSEAFVHLAAGNYFVLGMVGKTSPTAPPADAETTITEQANVVEMLKASLAFVRTSAESLSDQDLEKEVDFFGTPTTVRGVLMAILGHNSEHLGQEIACARMNDMVPPWSAKSGA